MNRIWVIALALLAVAAARLCAAGESRADRHAGGGGDLQDEVGEARIWGGIHYRSSIENGVTIGKRTVEQVLSRHFQASDG